MTAEKELAGFFAGEQYIYNSPKRLFFMWDTPSQLVYCMNLSDREWQKIPNLNRNTALYQWKELRDSVPLSLLDLEEFDNDVIECLLTYGADL